MVVLIIISFGFIKKSHSLMSNFPKQIHNTDSHNLDPIQVTEYTLDKELFLYGSNQNDKFKINAIASNLEFVKKIYPNYEAITCSNGVILIICQIILFMP